jgi:hypothetical protein
VGSWGGGRGDGVWWGRGAGTRVHRRGEAWGGTRFHYLVSDPPVAESTGDGSI